MADYKLPDAITTTTQLVNVLENLEDILEGDIQNSINAEEGEEYKNLPEISPTLAQVIRDNKIKIDTRDLQELRAWLLELRRTAPIVHLSFANKPDDNTVIVRLIRWLRVRSGKDVLARISVQPDIIAGCTVRTPLHKYDFSVSRYLLDNVELFAEVLNEEISSDAVSSSSA